LFKPLVVIAGPTGSGKSSLALHVAEAFTGEVVNCDSLQVFKGFDVGTAKIPRSERRNIPHHMIDVRDPREGYSAGDYARDARCVITEISARAALPVIAGGTGFYLRALMDGLPQLPGRDEVLRTKLLQSEERRPGSLQRILRRLDRQAGSRIHARDLQKTIRALEVRILTREARPPSSESEPLRDYRVLKLGLDPDRAILYKSLDVRTQEMFRRGLIDEVRALLASGLTGLEKPFESLGYQQALAHLRGQMSFDEAIAFTQLQTRQYAKRQWTWFRKDPEMVWMRGFGHEPSVVEQALSLVRAYVRE
jgi:tRNA dimethylallyltransferase